MADVDLDAQVRHLQREYADLLEAADSPWLADIKEMINNNETRLVININAIRSRNAERAQQLTLNFAQEMTAFQRALKEAVAAIEPAVARSHPEFHIGLKGSFGAQHLNPRTLTSLHLNRLVCLEGIITKCSLVKPKIVQSVHYCPATGKFMERNYTDLVSLEAFPSSAAYPKQDDDGNPLQTEFGLSFYKDHQTITMQELPEKAPTGQLPRVVDIICENDLVDQCKPGDRVQVVGCFRCLPSKLGGFTPGTFRSVIIANNIISMSKEEEATLSAKDIETIKKLAKSEKDIFETLSRSLAPSIQGHEYVKKALLCMLLGGVEKVLPNGSRLRGDINVLLIGDPSVAKSQLLRYVLGTANRAVTTTGRGSSGVGLTAAVTTDNETGERRLEAGAMVLADKGIVCIDEFDKMTDMDRTAIHEVMEQGKVTISKAGIHARLNARCSVLAAANPVYGRYDPHKTPMENIGLQDSLLSRFDLLFVMLDTIDAENDQRIADHVVGVHRYRSSKEADGMVTEIAGGIEEFETGNSKAKRNSKNVPESIWEKPNKLLHAGTGPRDRFMTAEFVKKYISFARTSIAPVLTEKACEMIGEEYATIRSQVCEGSDVAKTQPITARSLETMIRLATAHAKARLSSKIEKKDADIAIRLVQYAYFKKVLPKERRRRRHGSDDEDFTEDEEEDDENLDFDRTRKATETTEEEPTAKKSRREDAVVTGVEISEEKMKEFMKKLSQMFGSLQHLEMDAVVEEMEKSGFCTRDEVVHCIQKMSNENKVMLSGGILYLI